MLGKTVRVHFVGIGGIGMSGIAEVLANLGYRGVRLRREASAITRGSRSWAGRSPGHRGRRTWRRRRGG